MRNQWEKDIVKSFGGWTHFCNSYGLKPQNPDENDEAISILRGLAAADEQRAREEQRQRR